MHAAAASAHTSQTPACHVAGGATRRGRITRSGSVPRHRGLRGGRHVGLTCPLDNGCAQPGCCVRFPGSGPGTGEVGARPTLTRNCERLCGSAALREPGYLPLSTGPPVLPDEAPPAGGQTTALVERGHGGHPMLHVRRAVACVGALTVALFSFAVTARAADPNVVPNAIGYVAAQQNAGTDPATGSGAWDTDPAFQFATTEVTLAIAEAAQTGTTWSTGPRRTQPSRTRRRRRRARARSRSSTWCSGTPRRRGRRPSTSCWWPRPSG